jgi:hypothetical protein
MRETPIITKVVKRSQTRTDKWPVVLLLDAETEDGSLLLRLTVDAAHELSGLLKRLPPRISGPSNLKKL